MSQGKTIRVGLLGSGRWADQVHAPGLVSHPQADLVAVCSPTPEHVEALAHRHNVTNAFTDYREMLAHDDLDAVVVASTNATHYPICMAALERGLHVFCEKPIGMTLDEARRLHTTADKAGVKHMVAFTCRWLPHAIHTKQLIDEGYIGSPYHLTVTKMAGYAGTEAPRRWRFDKERSGGGVLADLGVHVIDLARWYLGEIRSVCGHAPNLIEERRDPNGTEMLPCNVEDAAAFLAEFASGVHAVFHVSWVARRPHNQTLSFGGENGCLIFDANPEAWELVLLGMRTGDDGLTPIDVPDEIMDGIEDDAPGRGWESFIRSYPSMARRFIDVIVGDEPPAPSFLDGFKAQEVVEAVLLSHRERRWVDLPLDT